jgi:hypothetical protein
MGIIVCFSAVPPQELERLLAAPDEVDVALYPDEGEPPHYLSLDNEWHGLHYLLTGEAWGGPLPLALTVVGGTEFGPDLAFGPARYLTPEQVAAVAQSLAGLSRATLAQRFDPHDMQAKEIYPETIWVRDGKVALDYVLQSFPALQKFYADAAARGDAVVQWHA